MWVLGGVRKSRAGAQTVGDRWKSPGNGHGLVAQAVHWDSKSVSMWRAGTIGVWALLVRARKDPLT